MHSIKTAKLVEIEAPQLQLNLASCSSLKWIRARRGMWGLEHQGYPLNRSARCEQAFIQTEYPRLSLPELISGATIVRVAEAAPIAAGKFKCKEFHSRRSEVIFDAFIGDRHCLFEA